MTLLQLKNIWGIILRVISAFPLGAEFQTRAIHHLSSASASTFQVLTSNATLGGNCKIKQGSLLRENDRFWVPLTLSLQPRLLTVQTLFSSRGGGGTLHCHQDLSAYVWQPRAIAIMENTYNIVAKNQI